MLTDSYHNPIISCVPKDFTGMKETPHSIKEYFDNGEMVCREYPNGQTFYYKKGKFHSDTGPAIIKQQVEWWQDGLFIFRRGWLLKEPTLPPIQEIQRGNIIRENFSYICLEEQVAGLSSLEFAGKPISFRKLLLEDGIWYLPNLPGM